ncbi:hypothetical protein SPSYN_01886 [Sporotomaculum syntrophicum]|uniref:Uncharacterized protein n=1 Tax=Sporotomaculum syntrophicum TaxID=182264 RepID=A0A9D2WQJ6_9FIRM|nr:hypothetical protein SPSYN_01886 [Sporotomaculum syntrophicum]
MDRRAYVPDVVWLAVLFSKRRRGGSRVSILQDTGGENR